MKPTRVLLAALFLNSCTPQPSPQPSQSSNNSGNNTSSVLTSTEQKVLGKWKPFQKGDWGRTGGTWFTTFGLHFYFRRGENMKGGWYIPLTKLNISFVNYWRRGPKNSSS